MSDFPFDVVAFDLDGTLADTAPDLADALNHALGELGRPTVPPEEVRYLVGHGARALLRKGLAESGASNEELVGAITGAVDNAVSRRAHRVAEAQGDPA